MRSGRSKYELQLGLYLLVPTRDLRVTENSNEHISVTLYFRKLTEAEKNLFGFGSHPVVCDAKR